MSGGDWGRVLLDMAVSAFSAYALGVQRWGLDMGMELQREVARWRRAGFPPSILREAVGRLGIECEIDFMEVEEG